MLGDTCHEGAVLSTPRSLEVDGLALPRVLVLSGGLVLSGQGGLGFGPGFIGDSPLIIVMIIPVFRKYYVHVARCPIHFSTGAPPRFTK